MSISIMSKVWSDADQKGSALLMLLALADYANDTGICWPKISTLAQKTRMSERQAIRLLKRLEEDKEIIVQRRLYNGLQTNNLYQISKKYLGDKMSLRSDIDVMYQSDIDVTPKPSLNHQKRKSNFNEKDIIRR